MGWATYPAHEPCSGRDGLRTADAGRVHEGARPRHGLPLQCHPHMECCGRWHRHLRWVSAMKSRLALILTLGVIAACETREAAPTKGERPKHYDIARAPTAQEIAAIDIDLNPPGAGLPPEQGTAATGAVVFASKC